MRKPILWGLAALMAVLGFVGSPAQAKEPSVKPLDEGAMIEGPWGRRGPPRRWRGGPRRGGYYGWGYHRPYRRYAPPPPRVIVVPAPAPIYYGGSVSCY